MMTVLIEAGGMRDAAIADPAVQSADSVVAITGATELATDDVTAP